MPALFASGNIPRIPGSTCFAGNIKSRVAIIAKIPVGVILHPAFQAMNGRGSVFQLAGFRLHDGAGELNERQIKAVECIIPPHLAIWREIPPHWHRRSNCMVVVR